MVFFISTFYTNFTGVNRHTGSFVTTEYSVPIPTKEYTAVAGTGPST